MHSLTEAPWFIKIPDNGSLQANWYAYTPGYAEKLESAAHTNNTGMLNFLGLASVFVGTGCVS